MIHVSVLEFSAEPSPLALGVEPPRSLLDHADGEFLSGATIFYVLVPRWVSPGQIDTLINLLDEQHRVAADLVIFRLHPQFASNFSSSNAPEDLVERFPGTPTLTLEWSGDFQCQQLGGPPLSDIDGLADCLISVLRHAEARALLDRSGVVLPADDTFHYEGPNGRHYESFVRVGTAIQSIDVLDGLTFWLLPWLTRCSVIVLDSWTILSLGLHASRYLAELPGGLQSIAVECQRSYDEPEEQLQQRLTSLRRQRGNSPGRALVVMSVSSTGATGSRIGQICTTSGFEHVDTVSLYAPGGDVGEAFCSLDEIASHWDEANCPHCAEESSRVRVMPDTYLLDLAATVRDDVAIRLPHVQQGREFFSRYGGVGAISVHRNQEDDERHHMIYVDVGALLATHAFHEKLDQTLGEVGEVDLVLCPEHSDGCGLAATVASLLGISWLAANPERLLDLKQSEAEKLEAAVRILVVDDIVMTGTRLRRYRNALHRRGRVDDSFELHFLAGVARPDSLLALRGIADYIDRPPAAPRFHYVELLLLPNWGQNECPWCIESALLQRHGAQVRDRDQLEARQATLGDLTRGLQDGLFMEWLAAAPPPTSPWQLGPESIFQVQTEPELFAAVANALQVLRSDQLLNERFTLPVAKILDRRLTISGRFYDSVITACLLRATRRHDLRSTATDAELETEVVRRLEDAPHVALHGELLFALARRHLPGRGLPAVDQVLTDQAGSAGVRQLFEAALSSS